MEKLKQRKGHNAPKYKNVEVTHIGQIGAGKVVEFLPQKTKRTVVVPITFSYPSASLLSIGVVGNSLSGDGISDGDFLIYRTQFERWEVKPDKICIVYLSLTADLIARHVIYKNGAIVLRSSSPLYPDAFYGASDIEIHGLVVFHQRKM